MIELVEQFDNLVVHWRGNVLTILYDDLLELLIPFISFNDSQLRRSNFLFQSFDLVGQAFFFCFGHLELIIELANFDCRIRTERLLLFVVSLADGC